MMVIRPVTLDDLPVLGRLTEGAGIGMTSLPRDRESLRRRVELSVRSFAVPPETATGAGEALFFFVLEEVATGRVCGTTAVKSGIGLGEPFYSYRLSTSVHASRELGVHKIVLTLHLNNDFTGCAEVGSLFLDPTLRGGGFGRLLSRARFLFLAEFATRFPDKVVAEMRGVSDEQGYSPFWEGLGRHFFSMEFSRADYLTGTRGKTFIAELMPRNPIYVPLLPADARAVIGRVHRQTRAALRMLEAEGFHYEGYVDIFDGGPTIEAHVPQIRAVRESQRLPLTIGALPADADPWLIASTTWLGFRCTLAPAVVSEDAVRVDAATAEALQVGDGDWLRVVAPDPAPLDEAARARAAPSAHKPGGGVLG